MTLRELLRTPYAVHGRTPGVGLDCYGLAICVLGMEGITLPDVFYEDTERETNREIMEILERGVPNEVIDVPEKNCIVEITVCGVPCHVGVCLGDGTFIHTTKTCGVAIEPLHRYKNRIKGYYRIKGNNERDS
jgi:cell wall-associated NlpC family hydrolase